MFFSKHFFRELSHTFKVPLSELLKLYEGDYIFLYNSILFDLRSSESRDHYLEDGNLVPSPRCGFSFEAVFQL